MDFNIVNNDYQQDSRVLYPLISNKSFGQLTDISIKDLIFLKAFNSEFSYIEVWFTDQSSKPIEIEDKINITLVINYSLKCKKCQIFSSTWRLNIHKRLWIFVFC